MGTIAALGAMLVAISLVSLRWIALLAADQTPGAEGGAGSGSAESEPEVSPPTPGPGSPPAESADSGPVSPMEADFQDEQRLAAQAYHQETPTYWPATIALGLTLVGLGIIVSTILSAVGAVVMVVGLIGWIGELLHG